MGKTFSSVLLLRSVVKLVTDNHVRAELYRESMQTLYIFTSVMQCNVFFITQGYVLIEYSIVTQNNSTTPNIKSYNNN